MKKKSTITACLILVPQFVVLFVMAEGVALSSKIEIDQMLNAESSGARSPASESRAIYIEAKAEKKVVKNPIKMNPFKMDDELEFKQDNTR